MRGLLSVDFMPCWLEFASACLPSLCLLADRVISTGRWTQIQAQLEFTEMKQQALFFYVTKVHSLFSDDISLNLT